MTEFYKVITDIDKLQEFVDWLPDLKPSEKYYVALLARKKYAPGIQFTKSDKSQLRRFVSGKEMLIDKIRQLELPLGRWVIKGNVAPQEALALYITPNPRCTKKATMAMMRKCLDFMESGTDGKYNIHAEALSCMQKSKSYNHRVIFDIDGKGGVLDTIKKMPFSVDYIETRGGYHVMIDPKQRLEKHWYKMVQNAFPDLDNIGDLMVPVPGTFQGGFTPTFYEK